MNKILLGAGIIASTIAHATPSFALTLAEADFIGRQAGEKTCEVIWSGEARTRYEAYDLARSSFIQSQLRGEYYLIQEILDRYGKDHPIYQNYLGSYAKTILENCNSEYDSLPRD